MFTNGPKKTDFFHCMFPFSLVTFSKTDSIFFEEGGG